MVSFCAWFWVAETGLCAFSWTAWTMGFGTSSYILFRRETQIQESFWASFNANRFQRKTSNHYSTSMMLTFWKDQLVVVDSPSGTLRRSGGLNKSKIRQKKVTWHIASNSSPQHLLTPIFPQGASTHCIQHRDPMHESTWHSDLQVRGSIITKHALDAHTRCFDPLHPTSWPTASLLNELSTTTPGAQTVTHCCNDNPCCRRQAAHFRIIETWSKKAAMVQSTQPCISESRDQIWRGVFANVAGQSQQV